MSIRLTLAKSLDPRLKKSPGLSLLNRIIIIIILLSLFSAIIETERTIYVGHQKAFLIFEYLFTFVFTLEYLARVWVSIENPNYKSRLQYMLTPAAMLDLLTVLLILFTTLGTEGFLMRLARLFRVLRIAKLGRYSLAMQIIGNALYSRRFELLISFIIGIFALLISSSILYIVEGDNQPDYFGSIPRAMWWAIATLTTVGYGDVYPHTALGKFFGSLTAITGIGIIAMPTGILAASFSEAIKDIKEANKKNGPNKTD
ncbi:TPA: ion transporter [Legionella pneumophila]